MTDDKGEEIHRLSFRCRPPVPIPSDAVKITGIDDEMVKNEPPFAEFAERIADQLGVANAIVAHNLAFDWEVLQLEMKRANAANTVRWPIIRICTVEQTEPIFGYRVKLKDLYMELFNEPLKNAHSAVADTEALVKCFWKLREQELI